MPFTERAGARIRYEVHGPADASPILLIMGLGLPSSAWHTLPERLAVRNRVITFDNRGTGQSVAPRGWFRIRDMADDAVQVLDAVGIERTNVFGLSMGGMIALELVLRHPQRVQRLVLGATFAGYLRSRKPALRATRDLVHGALFRSPRANQRLACLLVSDGYVAKQGAEFGAWLRSTGMTPISTTTRQMLAVALHATESRLGAIATPTLVLTGDQDRLVNPGNSSYLARRIPNARLVELRGAGHCFPLEREDDTVGVLEDWFASGHVRDVG